MQKVNTAPWILGQAQVGREGFRVDSYLRELASLSLQNRVPKPPCILLTRLSLIYVDIDI